MKLPKLVELKDSDQKYLYRHDIKEFFGRKSWEKYVYMNRFHTVIDFVRRNVVKHSAIIDVGCAQGNFSLSLAEIGYKTHGVDLRSNFIAYAKLKTSFEEEHNVEWIVADAKNLPFQKSSIDCVLLLEILEHTTTPEKMVKEAYRVLKKGGYLIISTVNQKRIRMSAKSQSYSDFKRNSQKRCRGPSDSTAKGSEHIFEFQVVEVQRLLRKFNTKILDIKLVTFLGFRLVLSKLFDHRVLSNLERFIFKVSYLKEKFAEGFIFFCLKS